jgi:hypothetical protein
MTGFSADWLALRERYDARARNAEVLAEVAAHFAHLPSLAIVDLACGTGATRRAIASHLPSPQHWRLVDNDLGLLARAAAMPTPVGCTARTLPVDLVHDLEAVLDGAPDLIVTTALLDLVSADWLERLASECAARWLPLYAALTYDGQVELEPADPRDASVIAAVNRHQTYNKGFGPALGPRAADALRARYEAVGYEVSEGRSDWIVAADDRNIQDAMLTQWARAAQETGEVATADVAAWFQRRRDHVVAGRATMRIGHRDLFARPMAKR